MTRLASIQELQTFGAMSDLDEAIQAIEDGLRPWMERAEPEEYRKALRILGTLKDLYVVEHERSVREGEERFLRLAEQERQEAENEAEWKARESA